MRIIVQFDLATRLATKLATTLGFAVMFAGFSAVSVTHAQTAMPSAKSSIATSSIVTSSTATSSTVKSSTDVSAQNRPRPRVRIYRDDDYRDVYPRYNPGPNAVRDCTANLVQEYRPSGTVIVPRMNCYWRRG